MQRNTIALLGTVALTCTLLVPLSYADDQPKRSSRLTRGPKIPILCQTVEGKVVAGAEVYVFQYSGSQQRGYVQFGPYRTDKAGRTEGPREIYSNEEGSYDRWIYARLPGKLIGVARCARWKGRKAINAKNEVKLFKSKSVSGKVQVPQGTSPEAITIRVQTLHVATGKGQFDYQSFPRSTHFPGLDNALPMIFETRPDKNGRFQFHDVPIRGQLYLVTQAEGLGEAQWRNANMQFNSDVELEMEPENTVAGTVLTPDGKPAVSIKVAARLSARGRRRMMHLTTFPVETDENGKFLIRGLPQTDFVLSITDPKGRWTYYPKEDLPVTGGSEGTYRLEQGVMVSGQVVDEKGKPIEGAALSAIAGSDEAPGLAHDSTDVDGRFKMRLPKGIARLYFNALPDGFAYPRPQVVKKLEIRSGQKPIQDLKFTLKKAGR